MQPQNEVIKLPKEAVGDIAKLLSNEYDLDYEPYKSFCSWLYFKKETTSFGIYCGSKLVCSRLSTPWKLSLNKRTFNFVQMGGTVVDKDYRGKGLFKKATLFAIGELEREHYDGIFNFSNTKSKPGYVKLGWLYLKGFKNYFFLPQLLKSVAFLVKHKKFLKDLLYEKNDVDIDFNQIKIAPHNVNKITTNLESLQWRLSNPKKEYFLYQNDFGTVIYKKAFVQEKTVIVIGNVFLKENSYYFFKKIMKKFIREEKPVLIRHQLTVGHSNYLYFKKYFRFDKIVLNDLNFGVKVFCESNAPKFCDIDNWSLSSIDLDTF